MNITGLTAILKWANAVLFAWVVSFILPVKDFLIITTILVVCDLWTGVRAAKHRGEVIHSKGFRRSVNKISLYFIAILLSEGVSKVFDVPINLTYVTAGIIALTEFKSNLENISTVTGVDILSAISDQLPSIKDLLKKKGGG